MLPMERFMNISNNEWQIIKALWKESPLTLKQLCDGVGREQDWTKHTVISFLKRMETKGSIRVEQTEERKYFYPTIGEKEAARQETESLASKVYGGNKMLLISNIVKEQELNDNEIGELLKILNERRRV